ncbi:hypothetical protein AQI88_38145 [Streptomyces cellostaticus]|uniref:Uncharacterized protein n=1 Tax=Streptomyces cellostaticus TaxID=67285 RepID=A0A124HBG8_9ACTN|nr:hypothetical protein AQI88_38145 [Streptomyces cellostaticus]
MGSATTCDHVWEALDWFAAADRLRAPRLSATASRDRRTGASGATLRWPRSASVTMPDSLRLRRERTAAAACHAGTEVSDERLIRSGLRS